MTPTGSEPISATADSTETLRQSSLSSAAESGAFPADFRHFDPDLALIVERWDTLPAALRAGIIAMVQAAGKQI
jgi:hypothetical protein